MKRKFLTAKGGVTALLLILLSFCLASCLWLTMSRISFAADDGEYSVTAWQYYNGDLKEEYDESKWLPVTGGYSFDFDGTDRAAYVRVGLQHNSDLLTVYAPGCDPEGQDDESGLYLSFTVAVDDADDYEETDSLIVAGSYTVKVEGTILEKTLAIHKAIDNSFVELSVEGWEYGGYDAEENAIIALPKYILPGEEVTFSLTTDEAGENPVSDAFASFTSLKGLDVNKLNKGTYYLHAQLAETESYPAIAKQHISFTVTKAENDWLEKPVSFGWRCGEFSAEKDSLVIANALLGSTSFRFYSENPEENAEAKSFPFETDSNGILKNANKPLNFAGYTGTLGGFFENLGYGTYYIIGMVSDEENGNYETITTGVLTIAIERIENEWIITPSIISWKWGSFNADINGVKFQALAGNDEAFFYIYTDTTEEGWTNSFIEFSESVTIGSQQINKIFRLEEDGSLPAYVAEKLASLNSGEYYLQGVILSTDSHTALPGYLGPQTGYPFFVYAVDNTVTKLTIAQWTWSEYNYSKNVISADALYVDTTKMTFTVYGDEDGVRGENALSEKLEGFGIYADGTVFEGARKGFEALDAGDYWLVATAYGDGVNYLDAEAAVRFSVVKHANYWTTTPYVLQWTWSEYNSDVNLISGEAKWNESGSVWYGIFTAEECGANDTVNVVLSAFRLEADGKVPSAVANELAKLDAGTYYLKGWTKNYNADEGNYDDLTARVPFTVNRVRNTWTTSPYVLTWRYGEYQSDFNVINAQARFGAVTQFSIYSDEACTRAVDFGGSSSFVLNEEGLVPEEVANVLKNLDAGKYYLLASVESVEGKYLGINETEKEPVPFEIKPLDNYWVDAPGLISWSEGHFDKDRNPFSGEAKAGSIIYTVYNSSDIALYVIIKQDGQITSVKKANGDDAQLNDLNGLAVGSYKLKAVVSTTANYSRLETTAYFSVFEDSVGLSGIIAAAITFAILDLAAAGTCIALIIIRRRKVEEQLRNMIRKELHRR